MLWKYYLRPHQHLLGLGLLLLHRRLDEVHVDHFHLLGELVSAVVALGCLDAPLLKRARAIGFIVLFLSVPMTSGRMQVRRLF